MEPAPSWVLDCNCSICRRYGALWAYRRDRIAGSELDITLLQGASEIEAYVWGDRMIGFWRCKGCGCLTHHTALAKPERIRAVNARMFVHFDPRSVTIHRSDSAHTGWFWSRPDADIWKGPQPPTETSGPDDWR
jgi:hypothetical protein